MSGLKNSKELLESGLIDIKKAKQELANGKNPYRVTAAKTLRLQRRLNNAEASGGAWRLTADFESFKESIRPQAPK